jgi:dTDP-4-amino-4,6-dideoxygalactose transaminase
MVPFLDLKAQYRGIREEVNAAILQVLESGQFVLGDAVEAFEKNFSAYCGVEHAVALNSGTSALHLALLAAGIGPGDEVITVPMTFVATTAAVLYAGATPVFVDVDPATWSMDPAAIEAAVTAKTRAILPVHLHGRMADMGAIMAVAERHGLVVIEDAAQSHGADHHGRRAGSIGAVGCFSFYPGKNLGAYGEGGAAVTNDGKLAQRMRALRDWGQEGKYNHAMPGFNYRMDGIQGAVLDVKMGHIEGWTEARRAHSARYNELFGALGLDLGLPAPEGNNRHVWHVYAIRTKERDRVAACLEERGVATGIHYPVPVHMQPAYADLGHRQGSLPVSERLATEFLSLPIFPEMTNDQIDEVVEAVRSSLT